MSLEIVTGYKGTNHVTAAQISDLQAGFAGYESCVLPIGNMLKAEAVTANKVRIFDGVLLHYGRQAMITAGAYEDVTIENGTSGLNRNDFIVARYVKDDQTGIEDFSLSVLKGQPGSTATDPTPTAGNIRTGALESEMPLYRVKLNGLAIEAVEPLFHVMVSAKELKDNFNIKTYTSISQIGLTPGNETSLLQISNALPTNSMLSMSITNTNTSLYPKSWGEVTFEKFDNNRTKITFTTQNVTGSNKYTYIYLNYVANNAETGWFEVTMTTV